MSNGTKSAFAFIACLALLVGPALSMPDGDSQTKTEKLWRIETSGIGG